MDVVIFHGPGCHVCHEEMEFLSRNGVAFTPRDVTKDAAALQELVRLGSRTLPTTVIDGTLVIGFQVDRLTELLRLV